jgi:hypothetical protein
VRDYSRSFATTDSRWGWVIDKIGLIVLGRRSRVMLGLAPLFARQGDPDRPA